MTLLRTTFAALPLLSLVACSGGETAAGDADGSAATESHAQDPAEAIPAAFRALHDAWASRDGAAAHAVISESTRERWRTAKGYALHAPKDELRQRALFLQLHVLTLREGAGFEALEAMDDIALTQYTIDEGLFGGQLLQGVTLVDLEVDGDRAESGAQDGGGRPMPFRFGFVREDGSWKVDLVPTYAGANEMMLAKLHQTGIDDEEGALLSAVSNAIGTPVTDAVWTPLSERLGD